MEEHFQHFPVVLTASRLLQPLSETPSAVTVIDQGMIRASGFRTVPELMRLVPGMYVGFADANRPVVTLRGATDEFSRRMQVLIYGRSVYLPPFGTVHWADLPLKVEDIERIEVVRGPATASHGTNAFFGVINIITRDALTQENVGVSATLGDARDVSARVGHVGGQFNYRLSVGYRSDDGIDNARLNDHNATRMANWRSTYHLTAVDSFDVQLGASTGAYGIGVAGRPEDAFRTTTAQSNFLQGRWLHVWANGDESRLTYAYTDHASLDPYRCIDDAVCQGQVEGTPAAEGFARIAVQSRRNELELQNTQQIGDLNRMVWGARLRRDEADYPMYLGRPYSVDSWQLFAHDEWRASPVAVVNVGVMLEDNGLGSTNLSPRASLNYHITPQHTLRAGISTATRSPAMGEVFMDAENTLLGGAYVRPLQPLRPERIVSSELAYLGEFPAQGLSLELRAYVDRVSDMIFIDKYPLLTPADSFKNLCTALYRGVDASVGWHWDERRSFLKAGYAYQQASVHFSDTPTQYFSTIPDPYDPETFPTVGDRVRYFYQLELLGKFDQIVAHHSASLLLSQRLDDAWRFSAGLYWRTPVRVTTVSPDVARENTMLRLDLRLARIFRLGEGRQGELALVVQNATQDDYTKFGVVNEISTVREARRGWLTATLNF